VARAEKFFKIQNVANKEKLKIAFISIEGSVNHWFNFWRQVTLNPSWNDFKEVLFRRYGGKERTSVFEKLAKIK